MLFMAPGGLKLPSSMTAADSIVVSGIRSDVSFLQDSPGCARTTTGCTATRLIANAASRTRLLQALLLQRASIVLPGVATDCNVFGLTLALKVLWEEAGCSWQGRNKGVHLPQYICLVGSKDVVIGIGNTYDMSGRHLPFVGHCLPFGVAIVRGDQGDASLGLVPHHSTEIVRIGIP